jgi:hypothetical protein
MINAKGEIHLGNAYADKIGEWDKVAITWGYQDIPKGDKIKRDQWKNIFNEARSEGLQYISDQDARAAGGMHPNAHLWDNGMDAVSELKQVLQVRAKALSDFGENNIYNDRPMAMLEDVLVPVYFYHRYQLEAVTKLVGGMHYTYAIRGERYQDKTKPLTKDEQRRALDVVIDCLDPKTLELPSRITELIPPRPAGYNSSRELFRKRTGLSFDALSPAETAADLPLSFLFNAQRLSRMAQFEIQYKGLGVGEMIDIILGKTWKAPRLTGMQGLIQLQTEQVLLTYLLSASVNDNNSFIAKAILQKKLAELKTFIESQDKTATDETYKGHLLLALERMKDPAAAKPTIHKEIPPGAPIGCDMEE